MEQRIFKQKFKEGGLGESLTGGGRRERYKCVKVGYHRDLLPCHTW
jgi:hypothetical protein